MHCQSDESLRKLEPYKITKILPGTYKKQCICYQYILNCILLINEYYMFISMEWNRIGMVSVWCCEESTSTLVYNSNSNTRNKHQKNIMYSFSFSPSLLLTLARSLTGIFFHSFSLPTPAFIRTYSNFPCESSAMMSRTENNNKMN